MELGADPNLSARAIHSAIVAFIAQTFFAYRVYILSNRQLVLPGFIFFLTLLQVGESNWRRALAF